MSAVRGLVFAGGALLALARCGSVDDPAPIDRASAGCGTTDFSICGYAFDELTDELDRPAYTAPFSTALMRWPDDPRCAEGGFGVRGYCDDGKDFLLISFQGTTEVRYYQDGRPIAVALMRAESTCGDPCPRESFYGALEDVRCERPQVGGLCGALRGVELSDLPFAEGVPQFACEECAP